MGWYLHLCHCEHIEKGTPQNCSFVGRGEVKIRVEFSACRKWNIVSCTSTRWQSQCTAMFISWIQRTQRNAALWDSHACLWQARNDTERTRMQCRGAVTLCVTEGLHTPQLPYCKFHKISKTSLQTQKVQPHKLKQKTQIHTPKPKKTTKIRKFQNWLICCRKN